MIEVREVLFALILISSFVAIQSPPLAVNRNYFLPGETLKVYTSGYLVGEVVKLISPNGTLVAEQEAKLGLSLEYTFSEQDPPGKWEVECGSESVPVYLFLPSVNETLEFPRIPPKILWISPTPPRNYLNCWNVSVGVLEFNGISQLKGEVKLISPSGREFTSPLKFHGKVKGVGVAKVHSDEEKGNWKVIVEVENGKLMASKEEEVNWEGSPPHVSLKLYSYKIPCYVETEVLGEIVVSSNYAWRGNITILNGTKALYVEWISGNGTEVIGFGMKVKLNPGKYEVKVEISDPFGNASAEAYFEAVDYPPKISLQVSPSEVPFGMNRELNVSLKVTDPNKDLQSVTLELISPSGKVVEKIRPGKVFLNLTSPGNWTITCIAKDKKNVREKSVEVYAYDLPPEVELSSEKFYWRMGEVEVNYSVRDPNGNFDLKSCQAEIVNPQGKCEIKELSSLTGELRFKANLPGIWEIFLKAVDSEGKSCKNLTFIRVLGFEGIGVKDPKISLNGTCLYVGTFENIGDLGISKLYVKVLGINWSKAEVIYQGKEIGEGKGEIELSKEIPPGANFCLKISLSPPIPSGEYQIKVEVFAG